LKAAIAGMVSVERRGLAYGIFNTAFGITWFLRSTLMGALYDCLGGIIGFVFRSDAGCRGIPACDPQHKDLKLQIWMKRGSRRFLDEL
jgi:hypothetical protein